jgi:hypothetical protein
VRALLLGLILRVDESLRARTPGAEFEDGLGTPFEAGGLIGFADAPLLKTEPGRVPNLGNSNWKLFELFPFAELAKKLSPLPVGGDRLTLLVLLSDKRFLYSRSSICSLSTWARKSPFSWFADSEAFSSSPTLVSKSLRCFSLRSRKARCAARFCAFLFYTKVSYRFGLILTIRNQIASTKEQHLHCHWCRPKIQMVAVASAAGTFDHITSTWVDAFCYDASKPQH